MNDVHRASLARTAWTALAGAALLSASTASHAGEAQPSPPSIGADVPVTYFGPPPSSVDPELVGPVQLLKAGKVDVDAGTITLPLYKGRMKNTGTAVWYILTDTDDQANAAALGLNFSAKLSYVSAPGSKAARTATINKGYRSRLDEEFQILGFAERGFITGPGGTAYGSSGNVVNCPIVQRLL